MGKLDNRFFSEEIYNSILAYIDRNFKFLYQYYSEKKSMGRKGMVEYEVRDGFQKETFDIDWDGQYRATIQYKVKAPRVARYVKTEDLCDADLTLTSGQIDAFNVLYKGENVDFFTSLLRDGFNTKMIRFFARKEKLELQLIMPCCEAYYIQRIPYKINKEVFGHTYVIPHGFIGFSELMSVDKRFYAEILRACKLFPEKYMLSRMDICVDTDFSYSYQLLYTLIKTRYNVFNHTPYVFGYDKDNKKRHGRIFKRKVAKGQPSRNNDLNLSRLMRLESFYSSSYTRDPEAGTQQAQPGVLIYDKSAEQGKDWPYSFRVEARAFFLEETKCLLSLEDATLLVKSYSMGYKGCQIRTQYLLHMVTQTVEFYDKWKDDDGKTRRPASWWLVRFLRPLSILTESRIEKRRRTY